jgi:hypothetical protein
MHSPSVLLPLVSLAYMGAQHPIPSRLVIPVRHARSPQNIDVDKILAAAKISLLFTELLQSLSLHIGVQSKNRKKKKWSGSPPL